MPHAMRVHPQLFPYPPSITHTTNLDTHGSLRGPVAALRYHGKDLSALHSATLGRVTDVR